MLLDHLCKCHVQGLPPQLHVLAIAKEEIAYNFLKKIAKESLVFRSVIALPVGLFSRMGHEGVR